MSERTYLVAKAQQGISGRRRAGHSAEAAAGAGIVVGGVPAAYRAEMAYRDSVVRGAKARRDAAVSREQARMERLKAQRAPKVVPVATSDLARRAGKPAQGQVYVASQRPEQRRHTQREIKRSAGRINEARAQANRTISTRGKVKLLSRYQTPANMTARIGGGALVLHGVRSQFEKAQGRRPTTRGEATAAAAGGVGGVTAYQLGSTALKGREKAAERAIAEDGRLRRILAEHRAATLPKNAPNGHPAWKKYNRTYPMVLPGARTKRFWGHAISGKRGMAVQLGVGGLAASGAYTGARRTR